MRTPLLTLAAVLALTACTSTQPAAPSSSTSAPPTSTVALALYDEWNAKYDALPIPARPACPPELVRSKACAEYLAQITTWARDLGTALRARPDTTRYAATLAAVDKVQAAADRYQPCPLGQGKSPAQCQDDALEIGLAAPGVLLKLHSDDIPR